MTVDVEILQTLVKMPESLKQEVLHYANYLIGNYSKPELKQEQPNKPHGFGSWAGQIIMPDDFDEPLEDMQEYM